MSFTKSDFELLNREVLQQGDFLCFVRLHARHRLYSGEWGEPFCRDFLERPSAAAVLPYDPKLDRVILIEQFRIGALQDEKQPWLIEIPAGVFEKAETPESVAKREAEEEASCHISKLELICRYYCSPGGSNEFIHIYCGLTDATNVSGIHGLKNEDEDIKVLNISFEEAIDKLNHFEIKTAPAVSALLWLQIHREKLRKKWMYT